MDPIRSEKDWNERWAEVPVSCEPMEYTYKGKTVTVQELTLERGPGANSLTRPVMEALTTAIVLAEEKQRMVVLRSEGKAFCSGLDRFDLLRACAREGSCKYPLSHLVELYETLSAHPYPTACLVGGNAVGGGVGLAFCCDVVVVLKTQYFRIPGGGYVDLARVLLPIIAHRKPTICGVLDGFIGRQFWADEAYLMGLVDDQVETTSELQGRMYKALDEKKLWPPRRIRTEPDHVRGFAPSTRKAIDVATTAAQDPEATRAIAGGLVYEALRSVEKRQRDRVSRSASS